MEGLKYMQANPGTWKEYSVNRLHTRCGGELVDIEGIRVQFRVCNKCGADSFKTPAEDMIDKNS